MADTEKATDRQARQPEAPAEPVPEAPTEPAPDAAAESAPDAPAEPTPDASAVPTPGVLTESAPDPPAAPTPNAPAEPAPDAAAEPAPNPAAARVHRLERLRRFFRYDSAREWAKATGRDEADAATDYQSVLAAAQEEARRLAGELAATGEADLIARLVAHAGLDLLLPVCAALQEAAFEPAVAPLARLYRSTALEGQVAILGVVAASGGAAGYQIALEGCEAREPALREAAARAVAAIEARHPTLGAVGGLLREEPVHVAPGQVGPLVSALLELTALERVFAALGRLCRSHPDLQHEVRAALWATGTRSTPGAKGDPDAPEVERGNVRALLLLGSQDWALYPEQERAVLQAFHRAGRRDRKAFLAAATSARAQAVLRYGLTSGARRNLGQTIEHLKHDRPDLVEFLAEPLLDAIGRAEPEARAEGLILLGRQLRTRTLEAFGVPRRIYAALQLPENRPWQPNLLRALVSSAPGRQMLTTERVDASLYQLLSELVGEGARGLDVSAICLAVADGLRQEQALDTQRLLWVLQHFTRVSQEARPDLAVVLGRALAAQLLFGTDAQIGLLCRQLEAVPELGAAVLPHLLPVGLGLPSQRLEHLVRLITLQVPHPLALLAAGLEAARRRTWLLLDAVLALDSRSPGMGRAFIEQSADGALYRQMIADACERMTRTITEMRRRWEEEEAAARSRLEAAAGPVLEELAGRIVDLPGAGPEDKEQLALYLQDLEDGIYATVDAAPSPLPLPPVATGDPLDDYQQAVLIHQTVERRLHDRTLHFAVELGKRIALPLEKICLAAARHAEADALLAPLLGWLGEQGLRPVEPQLGRAVHLDRSRHQPMREGAGTRYAVAAPGLMAADGTVIHPALVTPCEEGEHEQRPRC